MNFAAQLTFSVGLLVCCSLSAKSDWQFTKWGDDVEKVLSYKADDIHAAEGAESADNSIATVGTAKARSNYKAGDLDTIATYLFRNDRLTGVDLSFQSPEDAKRALSVLRSQYGMAVTAKERIQRGCEVKYFEWSDDKNGNFVAFNMWQCPGAGVNSSVLYTPIGSTKDSGL